jgi:protein involved in polysaccharide export with SLBB domain
MRKLFFLAACLQMVLPGGIVCQSPLDADPGSSVRTRADLERLLMLYEQAMASPVYSAGVKEQAEVNAERIRVRLERGDFRVGDRIALYVEGEPNLPDTVPVESGPSITLPLFGRIGLEGVLRSEISEHLTEQLGQFIKDPVVRASGLMRLSVQGEVGNPGFYVVPAEMLVTEALMAAGGPSGSADLSELRIERGTELLASGEELQEALRDGWTLDQLNMQAGDQIVLPAESGGIWGRVGRVALVVVPLIALGIRGF